MLHRSKRWEATPWPSHSVKEVVVDPMDVFKDGGWTDIYTPNVQIYHGQYVGLPAVFFRRPLEDRSATAGPIYPVFMHSVDGRKWDFPDRKHPIIELESHVIKAAGTTEVGMVFPAANMVESGDGLRIYYSSRGYQHYEDSPGDRNDVSYNLAVLRKDGFASLRSQGDRPGVWLTSELTVPNTATALHVNPDVAGTLQAEVLHPRTEAAIGSLSKDNCMAFSGDKTSGTTTWESSTFDRIRGKTVRLRFLVSKGQVFSFWFD